MGKILDYHCFACNESWETNQYGGLVPQFVPDGAWYSFNNEKDNCPGCFEIELTTKGLWIWAKTRNVL